MAYEIDFIGVPNKDCSQDAAAFAVRWQQEPRTVFLDFTKVMVYDGGFEAHGKAMVEHLKKYYFSGNNGVIDAVVVSHSDQDHVSGIKELLNNFRIKALYMNRPWLYAEELYAKVDDGRITPNSLKDRLRAKYQYIAELEDLAIAKDIPIYEVFQGDVIGMTWKVLSPSKEFYKQLIVESPKSPLSENTDTVFLGKALMRFSNLLEDWGHETLRENVETTPDNEMSVILHATLEHQGILFTGDAGIRALNEAMDYADSIKMSLKDNTSFIQIPHHGGRHNVSPSVLNRLIGNKTREGYFSGKIAYVSVAEKSDHPLKMVVNGFIRRGVKVYKTVGTTLWRNVKMPVRQGWGPAMEEKFNPQVEEWDD